MNAAFITIPMHHLQHRSPSKINNNIQSGTLNHYDKNCWTRVVKLNREKGVTINKIISRGNKTKVLRLNVK